MADDPTQQPPRAPQRPDASCEAETSQAETGPNRRRVLQGAAGTSAGVFVSVLANRSAFANGLTESCRNSIRPGASLGCRERHLPRRNNAGGNGVGNKGGNGVGASGTE